MSRSRRQRDAVAPSLFPFLAVLLCTMGALVLILMLIVAGAQASAQQIAKVAEEQVEEVESQLQLASYAYEKQLTQGRLELEKKRLALQHLEQHIQELLAELEQVQRTAELAREEAANDEASKAAQAEALSQLEKQLLEAQEALRQKLDKPQGDKPIFAIIPYDGPNGTHRRPIYLECLETGIKIQPEGVLLQLDDLQPPYGPGNPLDAALRTIRTQYVPANHALTSTAYPLLVVRPSGIRTYAMARAAMSGWDDQFGYELIGEDLELSFPQGEPGLKNKIVQAVELARQRQAALVMAMPKKYRRLSELPDGPLEGGGSAGNYDGMAGGNGEYSSQEHHPANGPGSDSWLPGGAADGNRGGFSLDGSGAGNGSSSPNSTAQLGFGHGPMDQSAGNTGGGESLFGSEHQGSSLAFGQLAGTAGDGQANSTLFPTGGSATAGQGGSGGATNGSGGTAASDPYGPSDNPNEISSRRSSGSGSSSNGPSNSNASGGTSGSGSAAQAMNSSGSQISLPLGASSQGASAGAAGSAGQGSAGQGSASQGSMNSSAGSSSGQQAAASAAQAAEGSPLTLSRDLTPQHARNEQASAVAKRRGRNWAWSQGPPTQTPVVRAIRLQCTRDHWLVLADSGQSGGQSVAIPMDGSPQARAEKLARLIAERVDHWGLALTGGYWKPILVVEVAPDAAWRFEQLRQLLDGSGLEIQRQPPTQ